MSNQLKGNVLIVEDNLVIALDAQEMLLELGAQSVHLASSNAEALEILDRHGIQYAMLDIRLGDGTSEDIAARLTDQHIPFLFASGFETLSKLRDRYPSAEAIEKPFTRDALEGALLRLFPAAKDVEA